MKCSRNFNIEVGNSACMISFTLKMVEYLSENYFILVLCILIVSIYVTMAYHDR